MYNTLTAQQSKIIKNSSRNFIFTYRSFVDDMDTEFWTIANNNSESLFEKPLTAGNINDFYLEASIAGSSQIVRYSSKDFVQIPKQNFSIEEFIQLNPYALINVKKITLDRVCYFGKIISNEVLDDFSQRIGSDVALVWDNLTAEVSNSTLNSQHTFQLSKAYNYLNKKGDLDVFVGSSETSDIIATSYKI
jgi:hypothetical protein